MDEQEQELALFSYSYSCPPYYVQSPSTPSHALSEHSRDHGLSLSYNSPPHLPRYDTSTRRAQSDAFSPCQSDHSFMIHHKKKESFDDLLSTSQVSGLEIISVQGEDCSKVIVNDDRKRVGDHHDDELGGDDDELYEDHGIVVDDVGLLKYLSFGTYPSSCVWIGFQLSWRFIVSLVAALLVFYIITKPPPPRVTLKVSGIRQFELTEGVDSSGVATSILTFNSSMEVFVDNMSKVFVLHIFPPLVEMSFDRVTFATSHGPEVEFPPEEEHSKPFKLYIGTENKAMYGAGRAMEDMLGSRKGLPLVIKVTFTSSFRVIWRFINPEFHHHAQCVLLLRTEYAFSSHCNVAIS